VICLAVLGSLFFCSFEDIYGCGVTTEQGSASWVLINGSTPSIFTGPTVAHSGEHYVYCEASGKQPHGVAR